MTGFLEEHESKEPICAINNPVVIVCGAGKRCTDVLRDIQTWSKEKDGNTAKLFAKHFKIVEQVKHLAKGRLKFLNRVTNFFRKDICSRRNSKQNRKANRRWLLEAEVHCD